MSSSNTNITPSSNTEVKFECAELPVAKLKLSSEVQNFKEKADAATGVVEGQRLKGEYKRLGTAPIVVWRRLNGDHEVVTGRHRLDLTKQNGEETIPCHIVEEADGFTAHMARSFDAESNIRDGQGSLRDYAIYFRNVPSLSRSEAEQRGLLSRTLGKNAWIIARDGMENLFVAWANGVINDDKAIAIAEAAPGDVALQGDGLDLATKHDQSAEELFNSVTALRTMPPAVLQQCGGQQCDLFGGSSPELNGAAALAKLAKAKRLELSLRLSAIKAPVKRQKLARQGGVNVGDKAKRMVPFLEAEIGKYRKFGLHPEICKRLTTKLIITLKGKNSSKSESNTLAALP